MTFNIKGASWRRRIIGGVLLVILLGAAEPVWACAVCFGAPDDPMVKGVNNGIWVLLGLVAFVQAGFVAMFWSFRRRARAQERFREQFHVIEGGPRS
jgi:heme/copper-type cytochrome/quinol oxidase subunit 2